MQIRIRNNLSLETNNLWKQHARQWSFVRPPLRPSNEDIDAASAAVAEWVSISGSDAPTAVVLGVTPELCRLLLNSDSELIVVDNSAEMIRALWPKPVRPQDRAICADWRSMPLTDHSISLILADGSFSMLPYPSGYAALCAELRRVFRSNGRLIVRCFAQLAIPETVARVAADVERGRIRNFHILKWRLAMALQADATTGVCVGDIWNVFSSMWEIDVLAKIFAWSLDELNTIRAYRGAETRYTFLTLAQYGEMFLANGFRINRMVVPSYELGERCPTFVLDQPDAAPLRK
jgi:hypothetical protein